MGFVRTWTGQLARAAGATLIAPLVLLLASGAVAFGGGLGGVGSLREIASGPSLPDIGLAETPGSALENAEIVGVDVSPPVEVSRPRAPAPDELASANPPGGGAGPGRTSTPAPPEVGATTPSESFQLNEPPAPSSGAAPPKAAPSPPATPPAPAPVNDLLEVTRGLGDTLRKPLEPLTNTIVNLLRGPPPR